MSFVWESPVAPSLSELGGSSPARHFGDVVAVNERHRSAEAYYWVAPQGRGRGVAKTALGLLAEWAFESGLERLFLLIHLDNGTSNRLAERCGFTREGVLRAYEPFKGGRPDLVCWSLLPRGPRPWVEKD